MFNLVRANTKLSIQDLMNVSSGRELRDGAMIFHWSHGTMGVRDTDKKDNIKTED